VLPVGNLEVIHIKLYHSRILLGYIRKNLLVVQIHILIQLNSHFK